MKRPLKSGFTAGLIATGILAILLLGTENFLFGFCTTSGYGWPRPWRIDYCECEGSMTVYSPGNFGIDLASVTVGGILTFTITFLYALTFPAKPPDIPGITAGP